MQRIHRFGILVHQKSFCGRTVPGHARELTALPRPTNCITGEGEGRRETMGRRGEGEEKEGREGEKWMEG